MDNNLRPLRYHEILKTLIRDHFENMIPGILKMCFKNQVFFKIILKNMGPGPGPLAQKWQPPGSRVPGRPLLPFWGQGPGLEPIFSKPFKKYMFSKHVLEKTRYHVFKMAPNQGFQIFLI